MSERCTGFRFDDIDIILALVDSEVERIDASGHGSAHSRYGYCKCQAVI